MEAISILFQIVIALGIVNVWLLRFERKTSFRGGDASNLKEEFETYGLPPWFMTLVGNLKISFASALIAGLRLPGLTRIAALGMIAMMVGAVSMHLKIGDPVKKTLPAIAMLGMSAFVASVG